VTDVNKTDWHDDDKQNVEFNSKDEVMRTDMSEEATECDALVFCT